MGFGLIRYFSVARNSLPSASTTVLQSSFLDKGRFHPILSICKERVGRRAVCKLMRTPRAMIQPGTVGLACEPRRRTPGLRTRKASLAQIGWLGLYGLNKPIARSPNRSSSALPRRCVCSTRIELSKVFSRNRAREQ